MPGGLQLEPCEVLHSLNCSRARAAPERLANRPACQYVWFIPPRLSFICNLDEEALCA